MAKNKKEKNKIRCIMTGKIINNGNQEVVSVDSAIDYVKKIGYIVIDKRKVKNKQVAMSMMFLYLLFLAIMCVAIIPFGRAEQNPTQQFNQIFLNPFYLDSTNHDVNYSFNVTVNPPDRISSVKSAVIEFNVWMTPTVNFYLFVNGQSCNTPNYQISTTYAGASQGNIRFDCSNIINKAGTYTLTLYADKNTGSMNGWLDLTYMNNPQGDVQLKGTEYLTGEVGTIFLQLKDSSGYPVNNGNCYFNAYYPQTYNTSHSIWITNAPMIYKNGSDGIYYYDFIAPNYTGVYIISAHCSYSVNDVWYFDDLSSKPIRTNDEGTWTGDTIVLNQIDDDLYTDCVTAGGGGTKYCSANWTFNGLNSSTINTLDLYWAGSTTHVGTLLNFSIWNYSSSSWYYLPNYLISAGTSTATPSSVNELVTNSIPNPISDFISSGTAMIRIVASGSGFTLYNNWLSFKASQNSTILTDIKGSGEVHIGQLYNYLNDSLGNISSQISNVSSDVWNYNGTVNNNLLSQIWNYANSIGSNILDFISNAVWTHPSRNLTYYEYTNASDLWDYPSRSLTYYPTSNITISNLSIQDVTNCMVDKLRAINDSEWSINIPNC